MSGDLERITVNLIPKARRALGSTVLREELTRTDAINRALQLYEYIGSATADGKDLLLRDQATGELEIVRLI